jgi:hypothetical protein
MSAEILPYTMLQYLQSEGNGVWRDPLSMKIKFEYDVTGLPKV